jgi:hypothetical protein
MGRASLYILQCQISQLSRASFFGEESYEDAAAVLCPRLEFTTPEVRWGETAPATREAEKCLRFESNCLCEGRVRRALLDGRMDIILGQARPPR